MRFVDLDLPKGFKIGKKLTVYKSWAVPKNGSVEKLPMNMDIDRFFFSEEESYRAAVADGINVDENILITMQITIPIDDSTEVMNEALVGNNIGFDPLSGGINIGIQQLNAGYKIKMFNYNITKVTDDEVGVTEIDMS